MVVLIGLAATLATLLGGAFAIKNRDKLHLILGFSAGAVIAVAFFDLLPEALELAGERFPISTITAVLAGGFLLFMVFDRLFSLHPHSDEDCENCGNATHRGVVGATTLSIHSFLDGAAIGLAFKVSAEVGLIVTLAVLAHDFSDGINTVGLILKNNGGLRQAWKWLIVDALAPALGVLSTLFFTLSASTLGLVLAGFCGFFIYIGASDLLPESHHRHPTLWTTAATLAGAAIIFLAIKIAGL